jgi:hypothetical protein
VSGNKRAGQRGTASRGNGAARGSGSGGRRTPKPRRPLPPGQALYTPGASAGRQAVERRSAALLVYLHQLPRWLPAVALAVLLIAGLAVRGVGGGIALIAVALVLAWLALVSWPQASPAGRAVRVAVIVLVLCAAGDQILR